MTLLLVLSLKLPSPVISLPSYAVSTGSMNASITNSSLTYKVLTITQPPYLHNLICVQCPWSTRSSSVVTLARAPSSSSVKITDRSFFIMSLEPAPFMFLSTLFWYQFLYFRLHYFTYHFFLFCFTTLFIHNSLPAPLSQILSPVVPLLPSGLPSRTLPTVFLS